MAVITGDPSPVPQVKPGLAHYFHPIATSAEVTLEPNVFPLLGEDVLVYRTSHGPVAFRDLCIHRGTRLSLGDVTVEGNIRCPTTAGNTTQRARAYGSRPCRKALRIPRKARAFAYHAREAYGVVWVAITDPVADVPRFPNGQWDDPDWHGFLAFVQTWNPSAGRVLENFCDWAHLAVGARERARDARSGSGRRVQRVGERLPAGAHDRAGGATRAE